MILAAALTLLLPALCQRGDEVHNTTWLPEVEARDREAIQAALAEAAAERWEQAAASLDRLLETPPRKLFPSGARLRVSVRQHVSDRILSLPPAGLAAYRALVDGRAEQRLAYGGARDRTTLEETAARWPGATVAATVLMRLLDLYLEEGALLDASRVEAQLRRLGAGGLLGVDREALERRSSFLRDLVAARERRTPWPCESGGLRRNARELATSAGEGSREVLLPFAQVESAWGTRAISCDLLRGPEELVAVGPDRVYVLADAGRATQIELASLVPLADFQRPPPPPRAFLDGRHLYTVVGPRPRPPQQATEAAAHALLGIDLAAPKRPLFVTRADAFPLAGLELDEDDRKALSQPLSFADGMIAMDGKLFVVVSHPADPVTVQVYLACLDAASGRPLWVRFLCQGAPVSRDPAWNRQEVVGFPDTPPSPLAAAGEKILVCTNLGVVATVDGSTGELLWAWRYDRITPGPRRPEGWPRTPVRVEVDRLLVTPSDSPFLYELLLEPAAGSVEARPPRERGRFDRLLGSVGPSLYLLERGPAETGLVRIGRDTGERFDAQPLQPGDEVAGEPLLGSREVWVSSGRALHRYDLERDLYLAQIIAPRPEARPLELGTPIPHGGGLAIATVMGICLRPPAGR